MASTYSALIVLILLIMTNARKAQPRQPHASINADDLEYGTRHEKRRAITFGDVDLLSTIGRAIRSTTKNRIGARRRWAESMI